MAPFFSFPGIWSKLSNTALVRCRTTIGAPRQRLQTSTRQPDHYFLRSDISFRNWGSSVLEPIALSRKACLQRLCRGAQENKSLDGSLAHAFYLLADLEKPIRSNSRAPCYFFIDPSI